MRRQIEVRGGPGHLLGEVSLWLFDLDNTLYDADAGVFDQIHQRMARFIASHLGVSLKQAEEIQYNYWASYGATFLGLERFHGISPELFFRETHSFDLEPYIKPVASAHTLCSLIRSLPGRKVVLTNGPHAYAERVLSFLGIFGLFDAVYSPEQMRVPGRWRCKPQREAIQIALARSGFLPQKTVLVDDGLNNLRAAKSLGMKTIRCVGHSKRLISPQPCFVDFSVRDVTELAKIASVGNRIVREICHVERG